MISDYMIIPDRSTSNSESKCNNPSCPTKTIYWNQSVVNRETGKLLPLNEPWTQQRPPIRHLCMKYNRPPTYIKKYTGDPIIDGINFYKDLYQFLQKIHWSKKVY